MRPAPIPRSPSRVHHLSTNPARGERRRDGEFLMAAILPTDGCHLPVVRNMIQNWLPTDGCLLSSSQRRGGFIGGDTLRLQIASVEPTCGAPGAAACRALMRLPGSPARCTTRERCGRRGDLAAAPTGKEPVGELVPTQPLSQFQLHAWGIQRNRPRETNQRQQVSERASCRAPGFRPQAPLHWVRELSV